MKWLIAVSITPLLFWGAPSLAHEGDTKKIGGPGGTEFHDPCGPGEAVVGIYYTAGKDLDEAAAVCQAVQGDQVVGQRHNLPAHGGQSLAVQGTIACSEPMVVQAIYASVSQVKVVHDFWLLCRNLKTGEHEQSAWSLTKGGEGRGSRSANCGDDAYALGTWGSSGSLIDAIGLTCATYQAPVADTPAAASKPAKPTKTTGKPQKPVKSSGKTPGIHMPPSTLSCQGGGAMKVTMSSDQTAAFIALAPAAQDANTAPPGAGQCAWPDRPFAANEPHRLALDLGKPNARRLLDAVRGGGTFQVTANPVGTFIMVKSVDAVQGADGSDDNAGADDNTGGGNDAGGGGGGGASAATDTTIYSQPDGNEIAYLSAGDPVTIASCNQNNWCQISKPRKGWVWGDDLNK